MQVSIITVARNSATTITDTLQSVLNQTYKDIDYWVIDGQSTDGTIDIVRQWQPLFEGRLHLISEKDTGLYDAMNKGVRNCTGDIVGILNSDDFFTSDTVIQTIVENFTESLDAVYGDIHFVKSDLSTIIRYYSGRCFRRYMLRFGFMPPHPAFFVKRKVYEAYGEYDTSYKISADFEFMVRTIFVHCITTKYISLDCVTMRAGGASTRSIKSHILGTEEDLLACRRNQIKTCRLFVYCKYFLKVYSAFPTSIFFNNKVKMVRHKQQEYGVLGRPKEALSGKGPDFIPDGMNAFERSTKRLFDLLCSGLMLLLVSPLFLSCFILIKIVDGNPAIYSQERIGRFGRPFRIYKFRSMCLDAEKFGPTLSHAGGKDDPRVTKVGKFIRTHHLDELPQLWNIFVGDMSFVGYRPERIFFIDQIMAYDPRYSCLYQIRPGVTSYATLYNGYTDTMEKMLLRLNYDLFYLEHRSILFDLRILSQTFFYIVLGKKF